MSSTELDETFAAEQPKQRTISRAVAEFTPGEGRTIDVKIVPYSVAARVSDDGGASSYEEMWMPGAFSNQAKAATVGRAREVFVNFEHPAPMQMKDVLGHGLALRETPDALYGSFALHEDENGEKAAQMVKDGLVGGISLEAVRQKLIRGKDGVLRVYRAHLVNIALCRRPAFAGAGVMAIRGEEFTLDEEMLPVEMDEDVVARCRRLGLKLPESLKETPTEESSEEDTTTS